MWLNGFINFCNITCGQAGKLAPHVYVSFVYLGHYYRDVAKNLQKARRCYEKAYQLSMNLDEIAEALSDIYRQLDCQVCT